MCLEHWSASSGLLVPFVSWSGCYTKPVVVDNATMVFEQ